MGMLILVVFVVIGYLVAVEIVGQAGDKRECGYWKAGLIALFLSPVFGMLYVMSSERKKKEPKISPYEELSQFLDEVR